MVRVGGSTQLWWYIGLLVSSFLCTVQDQSVQSAVPSDLYDYLEKMDRDEEEAEEQVSSCACTAHKPFSSHVYMCMWVTVPLSQAQTWSFEINQEHLETLQRRYRVLYMCLYDLTTSPLLSSSLSVPLSISLSLSLPSLVLPPSSGVFSWSILCLPNMTSEMTLTILTSSMHGRIVYIHAHTRTYMHIHACTQFMQ